jgi:hypothetical protein
MQPGIAERMCTMRKLLGMLVAVSLGGCFATVGPDGRPGGGEVSFTIGLPMILPPLIVVEPGFSVVSGLDSEVFFANDYYWARQDQRWYRSRDHRTGWAHVDDSHVPPAIERSPPGRYRNYRGSQAPHGEHGRGPVDGSGGDHARGGTFENVPG